MKLLIVDDEKLARERLQRLLANMNDIHSIDEADSGTSALAKIKTHSPDIILLDIRMPGLDGMGLAHKLQALKSPPLIIFTTAYSEHALEAFGVEAIDYLLKPIRKEKLAHAIRKARERIMPIAKTEEPMLRAIEKGKVSLIPLSDILYFQAESKYVTACLSERNLLLEESLKQLESRFDKTVIRVHRNALVPQQQIIGIIKMEDDEQHIQLKGG
ncbi:MAG: response regulator transcription factor, partial [Chromatiales bacterium]|nr:response regulator transcription factor [Chromatiales bacterium]